MKLRRVKLVGCGHRSNQYLNHEGYSDPTAGCALAGSTDIYAAPIVCQPGEKKIVYKRVPPVSEMDEFLAAQSRKNRTRKKRKRGAGNNGQT